MKTSINLFNRSFTAIMLVAVISVFSACSSESGKTEETTEPVEEKQELNQAQQVLYSMPSPFELASLLKTSGATFSRDLINSPDNVAKYSTAKARALNLGIYGADLSYASIFAQTKDALDYLNCVKQLTVDLGISQAFDNQTMERVNKTMQKKNETERDDELQQIVSEAYLTANAFLKDNERAKTASLILAGGWIEGLYIAASLSKTTEKNTDLLNMMAEQKFSLENLIDLLKAYEDDQQVAEVLKDMNELMALYSKVEESETAKLEVKTDTVTNVTEIGGESGLSITPETAAEITAKISAIRTVYVQ